MILSEQEKKEWLQLALSENVGPITFRNLLSFFGTPKEAMAHVNEFARRGGRTRPIMLATEKQIDEQFKLAEEFNSQIITLNDPSYPKLLKDVFNNFSNFLFINTSQKYKNSTK